MPSASVVLVVGLVDRAVVMDALADLGFDIDDGLVTRVTMLDTFDGRLHRAGVRLEVHDADGLEEILLTVPGDSTMRRTLLTAAHGAADLPGGTFRSVVEAHVGTRPLVSRLAFVTRRTRAIRYDRNGMGTAEVLVSEQITIAGDDDTTEQDHASIVEVHSLRPGSKHAHRAVEALVQLGLDGREGDTLDVLGRAVGVEFAGAVKPGSVPLNPRASAVSGVIDVLLNQATSIEANWQGTIDNAGPDFLHDLRVALRRTRSIVAQFDDVLPADFVAEAGRRLGWLSAVTGPARDLDVYLLEWADYSRPLDADTVVALEPARAVLVQRQTAAQTELSATLASRAATRWMTKWRSTLDAVPTLEPQGASWDASLVSAVHRRVVDAQATLLDNGRLIGPDTPADEVHELRKDAKRLRYLLECFATVLAEGPRKKFVKRLKALQDNLGTHQDAEVHIAILHDVAAELNERGDASPATSLALEQLAQRLDDIRLTARGKFAERFERYDSEATIRAFDGMLDELQDLNTTD